MFRASVFVKMSPEAPGDLLINVYYRLPQRSTSPLTAQMNEARVHVLKHKIEKQPNKHKQTLYDLVDSQIWLETWWCGHFVLSQNAHRSEVSECSYCVWKNSLWTSHAFLMHNFLQNLKSQLAIFFRAVTHDLHLMFHPGPGQCLCPHNLARNI